MFTVLVSRTTRFCCFFFFNDTATTEIYTLSLHDALPISQNAPSRAKTEPRRNAPALWASRIWPMTAPVRPTPTEAPMPVARRWVGNSSENDGYADTQAQVAKNPAMVNAVRTAACEPVVAAAAQPSMLAAAAV